MTKILFTFVGITLGVLVTLAIVLQNQKTPVVKPESNAQIIDQHFIEQMIPHHEDAITIAKIALTKETRPEIKTLSENIIESQGKEIEKMKEWYKEWFGRELPTGNEIMQHHGMGSNTSFHMGVRGTEEDIEMLTNAPDINIAFIENMIPHHQMAVMMASMLKNGTVKPEMKKLADEIITAQTKEIEQMRNWLENWEN